MFFVKFVEASLFRFSHDSLSIDATWESGGNKRLVKLWLLSFFCRAAVSFNKSVYPIRRYVVLRTAIRLISVFCNADTASEYG